MLPSAFINCPRLSAVLLLFGFVPPGFAQDAVPLTAASGTAENKESPVLLDPFYVKTPIADATLIEADGSKVTSVDSEQWKELNAQDLASALRRVPGVTVSRYGIVGSYGGYEGGAIFIRGHGTGRPGSEISLMTDGIPRFVGVWTHPILDMISIDTAQRLDVYKNPQPVRFGNMAWGAVDAVSKRVEREGDVTTRAEVSGGSFGTGAFVLEHGAKTSKTDYYFAFADRLSDGHRDNADGETRTLYGRLGYHFSDELSLSFQMNANTGWANDPEPEGVSLPIVERFETDTYFYLLTLEHEGAEAHGFAKLYYDNGSMDWRQWAKPPPAAAPYQNLRTQTDFDNYGMRALETFDFSQAGSISTGLDLDFYGGKSTESYQFFGEQVAPRTTFWNLSPYVNIQQSFFDAWKLTPSAGIRYNQSRYFGGDLAGQVALSLEHGRNKVFVQYSHAYNYAGVYASIFSDRWGIGSSWKDLDPELLDHWEIGFQSTWGAFEFECSFFYDEVKDSIVLSPPPPFPGLIENLGGYHREGSDGSITWRPDESWAFFVGACWLNPSRDDLPNTPRWTSSVGVQWSIIENLRFSVDYQYVGDQIVLSPRWGTGRAEIAGYNLFNAHLAWTCLNTPKQTIEIFISGENLTDENYELRKGYPMPGISGTLGVRMSF